jgi:hypothetical protein
LKKYRKFSPVSGGIRRRLAAAGGRLRDSD